MGRLVHETLTTDRVDDISRNVLSVHRRLAGVVRLPALLKIGACSVGASASAAAHAPA